MERTQVSSSSIVSIGYDSDQMILEVEFTNGNIYQVYGVPEDVNTEFMQTSSKGTYYNLQIRKAGYQIIKL